MNAIAVQSEETTHHARVTTTLRLPARPEAVWRCLMFYEDVPAKPWPILRFFLPRPIRSEGDRLSVGSPIRCTYDRGYLVKRITRVEAPRWLGFEVMEQCLGIERFARAREGSYELEPAADGTRIALTTIYEGRLWPRSLWARFESYLVHCLHHHILRGMRLELEAESRHVPAFSPGD
jgi:hypothetical protein